MRQILPDDAEVDPVEAYLRAPRPMPPDRPWVVVGMIQTLDGATALEGTSGGLGGDADRVVFRAVRAIADVILVAGGTVRAEHYGPLRHSDEVRAARRAVGRSDEPPRLAIVSGSLDLDPTSELFTEAPRRPVVFTTESSPAAPRAALERLADVHIVGDTWVDLSRALAQLRDDGAEVVVSEGGPSLNGGLVDGDLVDEWCLSLGPVIAGGDSARIVRGASPVAAPAPLQLASLLTRDDLLFGRWVRKDAPG